MVNSTVRVAHVPTGVSAFSDELRTQRQNRDLALRVVMARIRAPTPAPGVIWDYDLNGVDNYGYGLNLLELRKRFESVTKPGEIG